MAIEKIVTFDELVSRKKLKEFQINQKELICLCGVMALIILRRKG